MNKFILSIFLISIGLSQNDADSTIVAPFDSIAVIEPDTTQPVPTIEMPETIATQPHRIHWFPYQISVSWVTKQINFH